MTKEYRLQGLSCANCAKQFEKNVNQLPGVSEAHVNFGASKIEVDGDVTVEDLEHAGAFDKIKVRQTLESVKRVPFYQQKENYPVYISSIIVIIGWLLSVVWSETHPVVIGLFLLAILIGGFELFKTGLNNLIHLQFDMNTLMTIAIIGASLIGEWREGATVVILFAISEALERYSMDKARASISGLLDIAPKEALIRRAGNEMKLLVDDILIDDILLIKPGEKIAMDGEVIKGYSAVNQAAITGESLPVVKNVGDSVFAGTLNTEGHLEVRVTKHVDDTTLAKMIHLVEDAQKERAASQSFVDQFAKYYTPAIILISILVMIVPPLLFNAQWHDWVYQGLAVLVVGCPCALVISTPVAIVTAIGNAARQGVLIKGGIHLETAGQIQAIAFDKTGTLTKGLPVVTDVVNHVGNEQENLQMMAAMEKLSQHPLADAVVKKAGSTDKDFIIEDFQSITGKGIEATIDGVQYKLGSPKLFVTIPAELMNSINQLQAEGKTVILFGTNEIRMIVAIMDDVRTEASEVIAKLNHMNINTMMLTGDNKKTAEYIATQMGINDVESELLPEDKLNIIKSSTAKTAMVGDGVNDAPALAAAHVGIAMGGAGTDTALETADIALMRDDLNQLPYLIHLSRKTLSIIKQNITFALGIKLIALLLVIPGWLTLWIAIFADIGATLIVTLNSLRLMKVKDR